MIVTKKFASPKKLNLKNELKNLTSLNQPTNFKP